MSEMTVGEELESWSGQNADRLRRTGLAVEFGRGPEDRPNRVVWINLESSDRIGELLLWTSGEVELGTSNRATGTVQQEHHHVKSFCDLQPLLAHLEHLMTSAVP